MLPHDEPVHHDLDGVRLGARRFKLVIEFMNHPSSRTRTKPCRCSFQQAAKVPRAWSMAGASTTEPRALRQRQDLIRISPASSCAAARPSPDRAARPPPHRARAGIVNLRDRRNRGARAGRGNRCSIATAGESPSMKSRPACPAAQKLPRISGQTLHVAPLPSAYSVSKASEDLPDPLTPVSTTSFRAQSTSTFFRLCVARPPHPDHGRLGGAEGRGCHDEKRGCTAMVQDRSGQASSLRPGRQEDGAKRPKWPGRLARSKLLFAACVLRDSLPPTSI